MIGDFGYFTLYFALFFALAQSVLPLLGYFRHNLYLQAFARPCAIGQFAMVAFAYGLLTIAFVNSDFSIAYVAANSHPNLPFMYRLTAVWGSHEGSILLWILILNCWTVFYSWIITQQKSIDGTSILAISILGLISTGFLCFLLGTSNPFLEATTALAGNDLNPLLQDPGFVIHPPMLYVGYVGFSVAFAITLAALIAGQLTREWARLTRQFALLAWAFLSLGITLGSWWSYRVLGWGGFWFWDPVENASLLPWLTGIALIHVLVIVEKKQIAKQWAVLLAIISFAMSILGTFLVRSGVLISAHTFANDPKRGVFLLLLLAIILFTTLVIYFFYYPKEEKSIATQRHLLSRDVILLLNSALLLIAMLTILLGTLYPLILDAMHAGLISVGAPYFNTVLLPLLLVILFFMGLAPLTNWQTQISHVVRKQLFIKLFLSIGSVALFAWYFPAVRSTLTLINITLCVWIILGLLDYFRILPGMAIAHLGFALFILGIILATALNQEKEVIIKPGNEVSVGPYQFYFLKTTGIQGSNYRGIRAYFDVVRNKRHIVTLTSDKRIYTVREMVMTKVGIHPGLFRDLYIALGEPTDDDNWSLRIYYKPFIRFIWLGGIMMLVGGLLSLRRKKI